MVMEENKFMRYSLVLCLLVVLCLALSGCAEKKEKVYRVGIISEVEAFTAIAEGCKAKMTELGYIEGKNIIYDIRIATMDPEQEKQVVKKYVQSKVDLIFALPTEAMWLMRAILDKNIISALCKQACSIRFGGNFTLPRSHNFIVFH
jgi:putative ABC transport system substrate-binding protein